MKTMSKELATTIECKVSPKASEVAGKHVEFGFEFCVPMVFQGKVWMKSPGKSYPFSIDLLGNIA